MNITEQQIALAEFDGWIKINPPDTITDKLTRKLWTRWKNKAQITGEENLPNPNNLNWLHELVLKLNQEQQIECLEWLVTKPGMPKRPSHFGYTLSHCLDAAKASASDIREALLRTIGKWKE